MNVSVSASLVPPPEPDAEARDDIDIAFGVMRSMADYYASAWEKSDELRALRRERLVVHYGWSAETIRRFKVGFDDGKVVEHLRNAGFTDEEILSTGAFFVDSYNHLVSRFEGRIVFPYLDEQGHAIYFAARDTTKTPRWKDKDGKDITPKYVKTKLHEADDDGISHAVKNVVFSTHEKPTKQRVGIIAEGMPDAISAAQAGYAVRSPITTTFKEEDAEKIGTLTSGWSRVVLVPDMEANEAGIKGAIRTAIKLVEAGRDVRIATLPHSEIEEAAHLRVEELTRAASANGCAVAEADVERAGDWKVDLNEFLAAPSATREVLQRLGQLRADAGPGDEPILDEARLVVARMLQGIRRQRTEALEQLVEEARPAIQVMIDRLPTKPTPADFSTSIGVVAKTIGCVKNAAEREAWIDHLRARVGSRLPVLRKLVEQADDDDPAEQGAERPVMAILSGLRYFRISTGRVFTTIDGLALPVDGEEFCAWVSQACWQVAKAVVGPTTLKDGIRATVGVSSKLPLGVAPIRYAYDPSGKGIWVDLADREGHYILVTPNKVVTTTECPVPFYRAPGSMPMPIPELIEKPEECAQVLQRFFDFLHIDEENRAAVFALLMSSMRPMEAPNASSLTRFTVGVFTGEHGSGKSTRQMFVRRLVDPREPASMAMPEKVDDLTIYAENTGVVSLDNQSTLSGHMSDALCRISTGDGNVKRSLFTNRDLAIFRGARPIFVNGITDVITRDDLLDRALVIHVERPEVNKTDDELEVEFRAQLPAVLGALVFCIQTALEWWGDKDVDRSIRMLQAARWAAAAEVAAGFEPGSVENAYLAARAEAVAMAADDPFVHALLTLVVPGGTWRGTMTDLTAALIAIVEDRDEVTGKATKKPAKDFPTTVPKVRSMLKRRTPVLRQLGLEVGRRGERTETSSKSTIITLTRKEEEATAEKSEEAETANLYVRDIYDDALVV